MHKLKNNLKKSKACFVIAVIFIFPYSILLGQHTWTGAVDSIWEKTGNWSPATIPTSTDNVIIPSSSGPVVIISSAFARTVKLEDTLKIKNGGTLTIDEGNGSGSLSGNGIIIGDFSNIGFLSIESAGILNISNVQDSAMVVWDQVFNYGTINLNNCGYGIVEHPMAFSNFQNWGEIFGQDGGGIFYTASGNFQNRTCAYIRMNDEIRITSGQSRNDAGIIVVTSLDSLVVEDNFFGLLHNKGGGGIRIINPNPLGDILSDTSAIYWIGCVDSNWHEPKNWILQEVPTSTTKIIIHSFSSGQQPLLWDSAFAASLIIDTFAELIILESGVLTLDKTSSAPGLDIKDASFFKLDGTLFIDAGTGHGVVSNGTVAISPGAILSINGADKGIVSNTNSNWNNQGLLEIKNLANVEAIEQNSSLDFTNQGCGIIDIASPGIIQDNTDRFINRKFIILNSPNNSNLNNNSSSGVIHNLGTGSVTINSNTGIVDTHPGGIFWSGCIDSSWENPLNWSRNRAPVTGDSVIMNTSNPCFINSSTDTIMYLESNLSSQQLTITKGHQLTVDASPLNLIQFELSLWAGNMKVDSNASLLLVNNNGSDKLLSLNNGTIVNHGLMKFQNIRLSLLGSSCLLENYGQLDLNEGTISMLNGSTINNYDQLTIDVNLGGMTVNTFSKVFNYGNIECNANFGNNMLILQQGRFTNMSCACIRVNNGFDIQDDTLFNYGYVRYDGNDFESSSGGVYIDEGYQYDPNDTLPDGNSIIFAQPISHSQFIDDQDNDGNPLCSGDPEDLCLVFSFPQQVFNAADDGGGSLRQAIRDACPGAVISSFLNPGDTIKLDSCLVIDKELTILGIDQLNTIIDGSKGDFSLFKIRNGADVEFRDMQFINGGGDTTVHGGAIESYDLNNMSNQNNLKIIRCLFSRNILGGFNAMGGAISLGFDTCVILNSTFKYNDGGLYGGAIYSNQSSLFTYNSLFHNNQCDAAGGAIELIMFSSARLTNTTITENHSGDVGGGIHLFNESNLILENSIVAPNSISGSLGPDVHLDGLNTIQSFHSLIGDPSNSGILIGVNGTVSGDPLFNPDTLQFHFNLLASSPCFNTGSSLYIPVDTCDVDSDMDLQELIDIDLSGKPRIQDGLIDMGAFEASNEICANAFRIHCGDQVTGNNLWTSPVFDSVPDCVEIEDVLYLGNLWYTFTGTGDSLQIIATGTQITTDNYIDIQIYEEFEGICTGKCIAGNYDLDDQIPDTIGILTSPGSNYYILIGNYFTSDSFPSIDTFNLSIECICGDSLLTFTPPNNFSQGDTLHFETHNKIQADNIIGSGAYVIYDALLGIDLVQGFEIKQGAMFQTYLDGCGQILLRRPEGNKQKTKGYDDLNKTILERRKRQPFMKER